MEKLIPEELLIDEILLKLPNNCLGILRCVPEELLINEILLKLPNNCLGILRCVSKYLRNLISSSTFVYYHHFHHSKLLNNNNPSLLISSRNVIFGKNCKDFEVVFHNYTCNFTANNATTTTTAEITELHCPFQSTDHEIQASCNGLLYIHGRGCESKRKTGEDDNHVITTKSRPPDTISYIWNPCTKEYKELPLPPPPSTLFIDYNHHINLRASSRSGFCGFGYDHSNDEYKILYYDQNLVDPTDILRTPADYPHLGDYEVKPISSIVEFKLYKLRSNTWTSIVDNPYKSFFFRERCRRKKIGLLVNGALHWIMSLSYLTASQSKIICFDIEKEVFREVHKPHYYSREEGEEEEKQHYYYESLQVLQQCLCMCKVHPDKEIGVDEIDIWMLKDYNMMDSWTKLFKVVIPMEKAVLENGFRLLRYYENNGEIVMLMDRDVVTVYNTVNHTFSCMINEDGTRCGKYVMDFTDSLVPLNSGIAVRKRRRSSDGDDK